MIDPKDPYRSVIVNASAGSGKTYQLSHRFLCLVACGASPDTILTITFTNKAAKEMRQRILQLASTLMHDADKAAAFDAQVIEFHEQALAELEPGADSEQPFRKPRSAQATAREVLAWSQRLRVITIDAVFLNWQSRFAYEAREGGALPGRLSVADEWQSRELAEQSFRRAFRQWWDEREPESGLSPKALQPKELRARIELLQPIETFLWLAQKASDDGSAFGLLPKERYSDAAECQDYGEWFGQHKDEVAELFEQIGGKKVTERLEAIASGDIERLKKAPTKLLKGDGLISGSVVRGEEHKYFMAEINAKLALYNDFQLAEGLERHQADLGALHAAFVASYAESKRRAKVLEFADAAKGCFRLFHLREYDSVRFYLQQHISHIMIDEFQDTNLLQWQIFRELALEILAGYDPGLKGAGEYLLAPSVFLVGDPKQSIYRFREAEASLLASVAGELPSERLAQVQLAHSYRSSPTVLCFVNMFFAGKIADFPEHLPAKIDGKPLIADVSEVLIVEPFLSADTAEAKQSEARWLAADIAERLAAGLPAGRENRPLMPKDIAILTRTNEAGTTVATALRELGLPVSNSSGSGGGLWARPEALDALAAVKVLAFPLDEQAWLTLLMSPLVGIAERTLWASLSALSPEQKPRWSLPRLEQLLATLLADEPELSRLLAAMVAAGTTAASSAAPSAVLGQLVALAERRGAYEALFGPEDAALAHRHLRRITHALVAIEQSAGSDASVVYHELLQESLKGTIKVAGGSGEGVQIMTIHKSKGLEFPLVYVMGCHKSWERSDRYWLKSPAEGKVYYIGTAATRPKADPKLESLLANEKESEVAENLRLLYVGLTRASQYLVMTGHGAKPGAGYHLDHALELAANDSKFRAECRYGQNVFVLAGNAASTVTEEISEEPDTGDKWLTAPPTGQALLSDELKILAPSRLLSAADAPDQKNDGSPPLPELEKPIVPALTLPIAWTAAEGTFIHACLERHFLGEGEAAIVAELYPAYFAGGDPRHLAALESYWRHILAQPSFKELTAGAIEVVPELAMVYIDGDQLISGSIDLVVVRGGGQATIIDFKTTLTTDNRGADAWRQHSLDHGYHRQLTYYRTGLKRLRPELTISCGLYYTAPGLYLPMNGDQP